jgi:hypothetical protein
LEIQKISKEDDKLLEAFLSKDPSVDKTLRDVMFKRLKESDVTVASGNKIKLDFILFNVFRLIWGMTFIRL